MLSRFRLLLAPVVVAGCAAPPRQADSGLVAPPRPVCEVWTNELLGRFVATVEGEQASTRGLFGTTRGAYFGGDGQDIMMAGSLFGNPVARLTNNEVEWTSILPGARHIVIGERTATLPGFLLGTQFEFNEACTTRDAALGVVTIVERTRERDDSAHRRAEESSRQK